MNTYKPSWLRRIIAAILTFVSLGALVNLTRIIWENVILARWVESDPSLFINGIPNIVRNIEATGNISTIILLVLIYKFFVKFKAKKKDD